MCVGGRWDHLPPIGVLWGHGRSSGFLHCYYSVSPCGFPDLDQVEAPLSRKILKGSIQSIECLAWLLLSAPYPGSWPCSPLRLSLWNRCSSISAGIESRASGEESRGFLQWKGDRESYAIAEGLQRDAMGKDGREMRWERREEGNRKEGMSGTLGVASGS